MSIKAEELPGLIAAAVQKAINEKQLTVESLQSVIHKPFTIGIFPVEPLEATAATHALEAERAAIRPRPIGIIFRNLDELQSMKPADDKAK